jgi:hypothetical protein
MPTVLARHASKHDIDQNSIALKMDDRDVQQILAGLGEDCINAAVANRKNEADKSRVKIVPSNTCVVVG